MEQEKLRKILKKHKKWLDRNGEKGIRADLCCANLRHANLCRADLRNANLYDADLCDADLRDADLRDADLRDADLRDADLRRADLYRADLRRADLRNANLRFADLCGVNMDYAVLPLWCGGLHMHVDDRIGIQMLYHAVENILYSKNTSAELKKAVSHQDIITAVNQFHRVNECGKVEPYCEVNPNEES